MIRAVHSSKYLIAAVLVVLRAAAQDRTLEQAARLDAEHKCAEAGALYERLLARAPDAAAALNNAGNHYLACGPQEKAQQAFERLVRINPAHVNANLQLARLALQSNRPARALEYLDRVDAHYRGDPELALVRAEALVRADKRDAAAAIIGRLANASDPRVLYALGLLCARNGFYPEAERAFSRVLPNDPDDFDLLYNLGLAAARAADIDKARASFDAALKARPGDAGALYEWGRAETSAGDYTRAVYLLAQAASAAPARPGILLALARAAQMGGYYGDSLAAYDRYLAAEPRDEMVARDRALVAGFTRTGLNDALAYLKSYVEKHPADAVGFYDLAQLSYRASQTAALDEVTKAIELDSRLEPAFFFRSWLLKQAGRYRESLHDALKAAELNPGDARAMDLAGVDYLELSKPAEAEKLLRKAVAISPAEPDYLFHLGRCLTELDRRDEARPVLAEFQRTRQTWTPLPREEPGIVESATLPARELARRVVDDYRKAVRDNPNEPVLRLNLSRALLASGETDDALANFRALIAMDPPAGVSRDAGAALAQTEHYKLAGDFFRRSMTELPESRLDLAIALFLSGDRKSSLDELERVPENLLNGDSLLLRGLILDATGNKSEALAVIDRADKLPSRNPGLAEECAFMLVREGHPERALNLLERAQRSAPADARLSLSRSAVLNALGRTEDALRAVTDLERHWPQWDRPYAAEALLLRKSGRTAESKVRMEIAATLGPQDPVILCVQDEKACACSAGIWAMLSTDCR